MNGSWAYGFYSRAASNVQLNADLDFRGRGGRKVKDDMESGVTKHKGPHMLEKEKAGPKAHSPY